MGYPNDNLVTPCIRSDYDYFHYAYVGKVFGGIRERFRSYSRNEGSVVFTKKHSENTYFHNSIDDIDDSIKEIPCSPSSLTNDSGVTSCNDKNTPLKRSAKKIHFASRNVVFEVDALTHTTNYTSSTPIKCVAHMYDTPKPKKVEIREVTQQQEKPETINDLEEFKPLELLDGDIPAKTSCRSTEKPETITREILQQANLINNLEEFKPLELFDGDIPAKTFVRSQSCRATEKPETITREILQQANLINNLEEFKPLELFDGDIPDKTFVRSQSCRATDEKFVVNLFESRPSKRWQRRSVCVSDLDQIQIANEPTPGEPAKQNHNNSSSTHNTEQGESVEDVMFQELKQERDVECVKMNQASNVLQAIKTNPRRLWPEELLAEKILLEADLKYKLIVNKIRELKFSDAKSNEKHRGILTLSNFEFVLKPQKEKKNKYTDFFVLTLSHDKELVMSQVATATDDKLIFNEEFIFNKVGPNFSVKAQVFSLRLKTKGGTFNFLNKKTTDLCPTWRIFYENVTTKELKESKVLKTSFVPCAEINITKNDIESAGRLAIENEEQSPFRNFVNCSLSLKDFEINTHLAGFLTFGLPNSRNNVLHWERKWCVLNGTKLDIFNYPTQEYLGGPVLQIDLKYCLLPFQTNLKGCLKRRNFSLMTSRFSYSNDTQDIYQRPNILLEKFFFSADNNKDFEKWTGELKSILDCLEDFHMLANEEV